MKEALTKIANFDSRFDRLKKLLLDRLQQPNDAAQPPANPGDILLGNPMTTPNTMQIRDRGNHGPLLSQFAPSSPYFPPPDQTPLPFDNIEDDDHST